MLDRESGAIVAALAADKKADGLAAIEDLKRVGCVLFCGAALSSD